MKIGIKGISYSTTERKYLVRITKDSKRIYLGRFSSLDEAKKALEEQDMQGNELQNNQQPILSALRAEFAPKKPKSSKNNTKTVSNKKPSTVRTVTTLVKQSQSHNNILKNVNLSSTDKVDQRKLTLHGILRYLMEEADKRKTSVFDVVVQEVAKLAK